MTLAGVILLFSSQEKSPPCCPYPSTNLTPVPVQDDAAIRKIMEQEHKDQERLPGYHGDLLEQQRQKYLERHKNGCSEVDWEEWAREQGYEDFYDYDESFGGA